jgi:hypothetical protein
MSGRKRKSVSYADLSSSSENDDTDFNNDTNNASEVDNDDVVSNDHRDGDSSSGIDSDDTNALMESLMKSTAKPKENQARSSCSTRKATNKPMPSKASSNKNRDQSLKDVPLKTIATSSSKSSDPTPTVTTTATGVSVSNNRAKKKKRKESPKVIPATSSTTTQTKTKQPTHNHRNTSEEEVEEEEEPINDSFDILLPSNWMGLGNPHPSSSSAGGNPHPGSCSVLIQVDPEDARGLDFEGVCGAMGRMECNATGLVLDLKGCQYHASILPGPTAMVVGFTSTSKVGGSVSMGVSKGGINQSQLRIEAITDEFATLVKTNDSMVQLDAVVQGDYQHNNSFGVHHDDN